MKKFKGTPGPWVVDWSVLVVSSAEGKGIADFDYGRFDDSEDCMNANLIAAAPDLLEALQKMFRAGQKQNWNERYESEMNAARTAISKALGEE